MAAAMSLTAAQASAGEEPLSSPPEPEDESAAEPLIVGGSSADPSDFPAVAHLLSFDMATTLGSDGEDLGEIRQCTAVLIDPSWALTAAHCITMEAAIADYRNGDLAFEDLLFSEGLVSTGGSPITDKWVWVLFGARDAFPEAVELVDAVRAFAAGDGFDYTGPFIAVDDDKVLSPAFRVFSYDGDGAFNDYLGDLALLPLSEPVNATPSVYSADPFWPNKYASATIAGYGQGIAGTPETGDVLRWGRTSILSDSPDVAGFDPGDPFERCVQTPYLSGGHVCAGDRSDGLPGACFGDSGGPLYVERFNLGRVLVGITSTGGIGTCGDADYPARFTAVAAFADWIADVTGVSGWHEVCEFTGHGTWYPAFQVPCWNGSGSHEFVDVHAKPDPYFADGPIGFLSVNQITTGTSPTTFDPDAPVTRGDMATFLYRFAGYEDGSTSFPIHPFIDVHRSYQQQPISWLKFYGLTTGSPGGSNTFKAEHHLTRAEMVTFLWRLAGSPTVEVTERFIDVKAKGGDYFAAMAIAWAAELGITTGSPGGSVFFKPDDPVIRSEVAAFLARAAKIL